MWRSSSGAASRIRSARIPCTLAGTRLLVQLQRWQAQAVKLRSSAWDFDKIDSDLGWLTRIVFCTGPSRPPRCNMRSGQSLFSFQLFSYFAVPFAAARCGSDKAHRGGKERHIGRPLQILFMVAECDARCPGADQTHAPHITCCLLLAWSFAAAHQV